MTNKLHLRSRVYQSSKQNKCNCLICFSIIFVLLKFYLIFNLYKKNIKIYNSLKLFERVKICYEEVFFKCEVVQKCDISINKIVKMANIYMCFICEIVLKGYIWKETVK